MPRFICKNPDCLFFDKEQIEGKSTYRIIDGEVKAIERFCPSCNSEREEIKGSIETEPPTYQAVGMNSNRRNWSKNTKEGLKWY